MCGDFFDAVDPADPTARDVVRTPRDMCPGDAASGGGSGAAPIDAPLVARVWWFHLLAAQRLGLH